MSKNADKISIVKRVANIRQFIIKELGIENHAEKLDGRQAINVTRVLTNGPTVLAKALLSIDKIQLKERNGQQYLNNTAGSLAALLIDCWHFQKSEVLRELIPMLILAGIDVLAHTSGMNVHVLRNSNQRFEANGMLRAISPKDRNTWKFLKSVPMETPLKDKEKETLQAAKKFFETVYYIITKRDSVGMPILDGSLSPEPTIKKAFELLVAASYEPVEVLMAQLNEGKLVVLEFRPRNVTVNMEYSFKLSK